MTSKQLKSDQLKSLSTDALRWRCSPDLFHFETTAEIEPVTGIVGQETAHDALMFGIQCDAPGQNVYVRGQRGTGRISMVRQMLKELAPPSKKKNDYCYVHNFDRPDHPRLITLPAGQANDFRKLVLELAEFVQTGLGKALDAEPYATQRRLISDRTKEKVEKITGPLESDLAEAGMALVSMQNGPMMQTMILPLVEGQPVPVDQLRALVAQEKLPAEQLEKFEAAFPKFEERVEETGREVSKAVQARGEEMNTFHEESTRKLMSGFAQRIRERFDSESVDKFVKDVIDNTVDFRLTAGDEESGQLDFKEIYGVNVVLHHSTGDDRPVVEEGSPSLINLLGTVEPKWGPGGVAISDYRGIRAGAILNADNGYLVLDTNDLISEPGAWRALMRTLRTGKLEIVPPEMGWMRGHVVTQPEPIPITVRVILIGDIRTYYMLDHSDPDFRELFKVLADFDNEILRDDSGANQYASVVALLAHKEGLAPFHRTAVAELVEHGSRIAARNTKLTARFGRIADIAREAAFLAEQDTEASFVTGEHVQSAIKRTKARASLPSRKFQEMVESETILVETSGQEVGQINGLAVMRSGPLTYGFPARITATIGPGSAGLINIEGRAQMSGSIHTKGFHILGGLLRHLLDLDHPLAFSASLAFEQSYGGIDGDSASGAEIVCLLSALTDVPVKQSMAMTGAIDQKGHLEAIGGVNEKIEGFFDACNHFGLTGDQGCVVPMSNAGDLMLRQDVVDACDRGEFHVYAVDNIYDAIELMTGESAGRLNDDDEYPEDSVLGKAVSRAGEFFRLTTVGPKRLTTVEKNDVSGDDQSLPPQEDERA